MRLIISGSRGIADSKTRKAINIGLTRLGIELAGIREVIQGDCQGPDRDGAAFFRALPSPPVIKGVPADWQKHGKAAGPIRNSQMAEMGDALIAIWDGRSRGTKDMIDKARRRGLRVAVVGVEEV